MQSQVEHLGTEPQLSLATQHHTKQTQGRSSDRQWPPGGKKQQPGGTGRDSENSPHIRWPWRWEPAQYTEVCAEWGVTGVCFPRTVVERTSSHSRWSVGYKISHLSRVSAFDCLVWGEENWAIVWWWSWGIHTRKRWMAGLHISRLRKGIG